VLVGIDALHRRATLRERGDDEREPEALPTHGSRPPGSSLRGSGARLTTNIVGSGRAARKRAHPSADGHPGRWSEKDGGWGLAPPPASHRSQPPIGGSNRPRGDQFQVSFSMQFAKVNGIAVVAKLLLENALVVFGITPQFEPESSSVPSVS